ncbi:MAG TPA: lipopolysaccharide kinase InaA family protein [Pirellulales bacterium]|nr:lipopolysaccharide kinase InaA family protein [Pirellulales bacterium]
MSANGPAAPDSLRRCQLGSLGGEVLADWHALVWGPSGLRLDQWLSEGQARLIKHGPRRAVYRVDAPQQKFFVKHYRCSRWWHAIGNLFRASPSRREFSRAREALRRQVPTAQPVAWFESRRRGLVRDSFLVTRAIDGACSLEEYVQTVLPRLDPAAGARCRRQLAASLARLCAAAHRQGIDHDDLHAGNLLVQVKATAEATDADGRPVPDLYLIDLPGVRLSRSLSRRRTIASLTMLGSACAAIATPSDMWRFWKTYLAERPELQPDSRAVARRVAEAIPAWRRRVAHGRDKRSLRSNRDFHGSGLRLPLQLQLQLQKSYGMAVHDVSREQLDELVANPRLPLEVNVHRPYKLSHRSVVVRAELPLSDRRVQVAYKRVRPRNWWKSLLHYFRRNPALEAWYYGHALLLRGIATARPLAVIERPRFGLPSEGYLATQWIEGAKNLHVYAWELVGRAAPERRRRARQVAEALGGLLGRMHSWHVSHRDLKGCNILVVEREHNVECFLIDADSVRIPWRLSPFFRSFNLGRLATSLEAHRWVTRSDRLRFWRSYLAELHRRDASAWPTDWKQGWRAVTKASRRIIARLRRSGHDIF